MQGADVVCVAANMYLWSSVMLCSITEAAAMQDGGV